MSQFAASFSGNPFQEISKYVEVINSDNSYWGVKAKSFIPKGTLIYRADPLTTWSAQESQDGLLEQESILRWVIWIVSNFDKSPNEFQGFSNLCKDLYPRSKE